MPSIFKFCPNCAGRNHTFTDNKKFHCKDCEFIFYQNTATACAVILLHEGKILFTIRNQEPGFGKLDLPGGFIEGGERLEDGLRRELKEELDLELETFDFFTSFPNTYPYKGVTYFTCDMFFVATIKELPSRIQESELQGIVMLSPSEIDLYKIAFESIKKGIMLFIKTTK